MTTACLLLLGLICLYFGAEWLVKGSATLALRWGIPSLVVGLTIVAFGTSAPELVVSLKAGLDGLGDIAVGNVVGSNIFNIAVILGLSALVQPLRIHLQVLRVDTPIMLGVSLLLAGFLHNGHLTRTEATPLFIGIVLYTAMTIRLGRQNAAANPATGAAVLPPPRAGSALKDGLLIVVGLVTLVIGSKAFVTGAVSLAELLKVPHAVIALTIVAAGTSLPELATSIVAAVKKEEDIAIGNIVGSNIFNILAILGMSGLVTPLAAGGIRHLDIVFMLATAALLLPFMRTGFTLSRWEGAAFLAIYGVYLFLLWPA